MARRVIGAEEHAYTLRSSAEIRTFRNHIRSCFSRASKAESSKAKQSLLTFVVIGAGRTGLRATEFIAEDLRASFEGATEESIAVARLILVENMSQILPGASAQERAEASDRLQLHAVEVLVDSRVDQVIPGGVFIGQEKFLPTQSAIWTPGQDSEEFTRQWLAARE